MAKSNTGIHAGELGLPNEDLQVAEESDTIYNSTQILVQSVFPAKLVYVGLVSGKQYTWMKAGDIVEVDVDDVPTLLNARIGRKQCCGNGKDGNIVFKLVD